MQIKNLFDSVRLDQLQEYLRDHFGSSLKNLSITEFPGGASNPTYLLDSSQGKQVLRSKPLGNLVSKAHAIDREYRVINALTQTGFPVPRTFLYCNDVKVIGAEFYVMEFIEGKVTEDFTLPDVSNTERTEIYNSMNETIAQLHRIDPDAIGLTDFGKTGNYFARQIKLWMRQYQQHYEPIPRFEILADWLTENLVIEEQRTIIHGDYRLANIIISPDFPKVAAVVDWELSTTGHPLADFTYNLSHWYLPNFNKAFGKVTLEGANLNGLGIPTMQAYTKTYSERVQIEITPKNLYYGIVFNLFRLAGIIIGVIGRTRSGTAKNEFARSTAHNLEPTIALAWHYVEQADSANL